MGHAASDGLQGKRKGLSLGAFKLFPDSKPQFTFQSWLEWFVWNILAINFGVPDYLLHSESLIRRAMTATEKVLGPRFPEVFPGQQPFYPPVSPQPNTTS